MSGLDSYLNERTRRELDAEIARLNATVDDFAGWVGRLRDENRRLRAEADEIVRWIVEDVAYPWHIRTSPPIPEAWRRRIEDMWIVHEDIEADQADSYRQGVAEEGGWA